MDVIAYARAVVGWPVAAEHPELITAANSDLGYEGEEVVGNAEVFSIGRWDGRLQG